MKRRRLVAILILVALLLSAFSSVVAHAEQAPVRVYFSNQLVYFGVDPVIENGVTLVQFRPIFEKLGLDITWDGKAQKVTGVSSKMSLELQLGKTTATLNGNRKHLDVAPKIINESTMVPLRFVAESSQMDVIWHPETRTITIDKSFESQTVANPYGGDSFVKLADVEKNVGVNPDIYQKGDVTYVTWYKDIDIGGFKALQFFASVFKNGSWLKQGETLYLKQKTSKSSYQVIFAEGSYYLKDDSTITKITPTESGYGTATTLAGSLPFPGQKNDGLRPVYILGDKPGVYYSVRYSSGSSINSHRRIYIEGSNTYNNYVDVKDAYKVLDSLRSGAMLVYNPRTSILSIFEGDGFRQLNVITGDLKYGSDGRDLVTKPFSNGRANTSAFYSYNGDVYGLYEAVGGMETLRFGTLNRDTLVANETFLTQIPTRDIRDKQFSYTDRQISLWSTYDFNRKPSVQLNSYQK